ncbi:MAG: class I SAM-dependent methyltransferase [Chloroflexia bacterium]
MDVWDRFVRWYDLDQGGYEEDIPFYLALAQRTGSPILEAGCGTGRLVLALAGAGYQVVGVEQLPAMLARAQAKIDAAGPRVAQRAKLVHADIRSLALDTSFTLAILAVNTLMHLVGAAEQEEALRNIYAHLAPGGVLALDLFPPHPDFLTPAAGELVLEKVLLDPDTGHPVLKFVARQADYARQLLTTTFIYDRVDARGRVERTAQTFLLRYLHRSEAERMLREVGFHIEGVYGNYELDPYTDEGERLLILARRPDRDPGGETFQRTARLSDA